MKRLLLTMVVMALGSSLGAQDWKGVARVQGKVIDEDGKPIPNAIIKFDCPGKGGGPAVTANNKGTWAYMGLTGCDWKIEFSAEGFAGKSIVVTVPNEQLRQPPVNVTLDKLQGPPPELLAAVKDGDEAFAAKNWAVARESYEKILVKWPEMGPQVYPKLARTYVGENNPAKAVEFLEKSIAADPSRMELHFAAAQAALDAGLTEKGMEFLAGVDDAAVKGSDGYFNIGISFIRTSDMPKAIEYFTKAIAKDEKMGDAYYWRGMSYLRETRLAEASADMQKVLEVDPTGQYAEKARTVIDQLKDALK